MSQYSKAQEDRVVRKLQEIGFELVEDVSRTHTHGGDKRLYHPDTGLKLRIDNKSTRGEKQLTLKREDLQKIVRESLKEELPAITFTFFGKRDVYIVFNIKDLEGVMY